jgi:hypothetical protein
MKRNEREGKERNVSMNGHEESRLAHVLGRIREKTLENYRLRYLFNFALQCRISFSQAREICCCHEDSSVPLLLAYAASASAIER